MVPKCVREKNFHGGRLIKIMSFVKVGIFGCEGFESADTSVRPYFVFWPLTE